MPNHDWLARSTSTVRGEGAFEADGSRSRGQSREAQYLRLQAQRLHSAGDPRVLPAALALLDRLINDFPDHFVLGLAYSLRAEVLIDLGRPDAALTSYEHAVAARRSCPDVTDDAHVAYVELILTLKRTALYGVAQQLLDEFPVGPFSSQVFRDAAARALLADAGGDASAARAWAHAALSTSDRNDSPVRDRRHPGFARGADPLTLQRLGELARLHTW